MSRGIADFFREFPKYWQNRAGEIRFTVEVTTAACITFRLDGEDVVVNWGDGRISEETDPTGRCHHSYKEAGIYHIIISGRDIINLEVKRCNILSLDVQACPTIEFIDCSENFLTELDVYNCKFSMNYIVTVTGSGSCCWVNIISCSIYPAPPMNWRRSN